MVCPPGYDLSAERGVKTMLEEFDQTVGLSYLRAIHLNDSKGGTTTWGTQHCSVLV